MRLGAPERLEALSPAAAAVSLAASVRRCTTNKVDSVHKVNLAVQSGSIMHATTCTCQCVINVHVIDLRYHTDLLQKHSGMKQKITCLAQLSSDISMTTA